MIKYISTRGYGSKKFHALVIAKKHVVVLELPKPIRLSLELLRDLFPKFYAVGLHDCDSGGRIFAWYPMVTLNRWHARKMFIEADRSGDGPNTYSRMSVIQFVKWKISLNKREKEYE